MCANANQGTVDDLFNVKNAFYIGSYQQCITEALALRPSSKQEKLDRDVYVYRAYIAQKKFTVALEEIKLENDTPGPLVSVRMLAEYLGKPDKRDSVMDQLPSLFEKYSSEPICLLMAAMILAHEQNFEEALRYLHHSADSLECLAMTVCCLLALNRIDVAKEAAKEMQSLDEDSLLTQMTNAWVNIALGREHLQDALFTFQEMIDKYGSTSLLLNALACCQIMMGNYEEAERVVNESLEKDSNNAEVIVDACCVYLDVKNRGLYVKSLAYVLALLTVIIEYCVKFCLRPI
uniref:Coatomer subunit epsilon n=1 Tax=Trichuris muris TaxID=70415 RepID=A0A5S6Q564_TRIMR